MQCKRYADVIKHLLFLFCLIFIVSGCSDGSDNSGGAAQNSSASISYRNIVVTSRFLNGRAIADNIDYLECYCYSDYGFPIYGPIKKLNLNESFLKVSPVMLFLYVSGT